MFNAAKESPGEWFNCLNVGDDHEDKKERRNDADLVIPGFSLVEIISIRKINDDHFVHEVRLPVGEIPFSEDTEEKFVPIGINYAFTGPGDIIKGFQGRMKFPPAMCRFKGDEADTAKIFGRFNAPKRVRGGKFTAAELDEFELQENLFGQGVQHQLIGDPAGHLKLPNELTKASEFRIRSQYLGWNCMGIYKYNTGEKTKGKKDDEDGTKNLLAYIAPAVQVMPKPSVRFITHKGYSTYVLLTYSEKTYDSYDFDGDSRKGQRYARMVDGETRVPASLLYYKPEGNQRQVVYFTGDSIMGSIKLVLEDNETTDISLEADVLTEDYLTGILEALPNIGAGNVKVKIWPGHWLIEFVEDLAGVTFDLFEVDILETSDFECWAYETLWAYTGIDDEILMPIPLIGEYDVDNKVINDALAGGSIGWADDAPGIGLVANLAQCREYNGDGTPDL